MSMKLTFQSCELHTKSITAIGYNPNRREIVVGFEDGSMKTVDSESGFVNASHTVHKGWVTDMLYWSEARILFCCGNDGLLTCWNSAGGLEDRIMLGEPIYSLAFYKRKQLLCGMNGCIRVYNLRPDRRRGHYIDLEVKYLLKNHTDIIKCIACNENRVYSAGFDQRLVAYEAPFGGILKALYIINTAHNAGISCLTVIGKQGNNTNIVTGSYDRSVKIWTSEGQLVHKLEGFQDSVRSLCYVSRERTLWVSGGAVYPFIYDPKSGDNVQEITNDTFTCKYKETQLKEFRYFSEASLLIASTRSHCIRVWKYNAHGCITKLQSSEPLLSLTYTKKVPILLFTGGSTGSITKWERSQKNNIVYKNDLLPFSETLLVTPSSNETLTRSKQMQKIEQKTFNLRISESLEAQTANSDLISIGKLNLKASLNLKPDRGLLRCEFVEELDLLIAACEDSNIYVWGFDESAVKALKSMKLPSTSKHKVKDMNKFSILFSNSAKNPCLRNSTSNRRSLEEQKIENGQEDVQNESTTNRVAGFKCRYVLQEHQSSVTSLAVISDNFISQHVTLVSGGWDRRLCVWNLETGSLQGVVGRPAQDSNNGRVTDEAEYMCEGVILCMSYSSSRRELSYGTSEGVVYIRSVGPGYEMSLIRTLTGHVGEVTCVTWNPFISMWVTASEDGTIRFWVKHFNPNSIVRQASEHIQYNSPAEESSDSDDVIVLYVNESVGALCVDLTEGAVIAAVNHNIQIYDPVTLKLVRTHEGHTEAIRDIIHVPERNQYISVSTDCTIRIWSAWKKSKVKS